MAKVHGLLKVMSQLREWSYSFPSDLDEYRAEFWEDLDITTERLMPMLGNTKYIVLAGLVTVFAFSSQSTATFLPFWAGILFSAETVFRLLQIDVMTDYLKGRTYALEENLMYQEAIDESKKEREESDS